jgi:iron complex transport system substrate-binding protein
MQRLHPAGRGRVAAFVLSLALTLVALVACGGSASSGLSTAAGGGATSAPSGTASPTATATQVMFPLTLTDDDGVSVTFPSAPQRVVTFAPANTEILFALGLGGRVVGVSGSYDNYPPEAKSIPSVGGAGNFGVDPNIEKVVALHPDLMLTTSGGDTWKARLRNLGIKVFTINATGFDDLLHDIQTVGTITGAEPAADQLVASMQTKAAAIQSKVSAQPKVSCFYEVYYPPLTTVGPNTFVFDLLQRAGCDPVTAGAKAPYPSWSLERLVSENPQVYLLDSLSGATPAAVAKRHGFGALGAVKGGHVVVIDSDLVTRPGPRIVDGLEALAKALHPEAFQGP